MSYLTYGLHNNTNTYIKTMPISVIYDYNKRKNRTKQKYGLTRYKMI